LLEDHRSTDSRPNKKETKARPALNLKPLQMLLFQPDKKPKPGQLGEAVRRRKFFAQQLEARPRSTVRRQTPSVPEPKAEPKQESPILLQQSPLITPTEPGGLISRYCIVYYWIEELLSKAAREGLIDTSRPEALWKMQENISKMRGAAADVFMYLYCKVPPFNLPQCLQPGDTRIRAPSGNILQLDGFILNHWDEVTRHGQQFRGLFSHDS